MKSIATSLAVALCLFGGAASAQEHGKPAGKEHGTAQPKMQGDTHRDMHHDMHDKMKGKRKSAPAKKKEEGKKDEHNH